MGRYAPAQCTNIFREPPYPDKFFCTLPGRYCGRIGIQRGVPASPFKVRRVGEKTSSAPLNRKFSGCLVVGVIHDGLVVCSDFVASLFYSFLFRLVLFFVHFFVVFSLVFFSAFCLCFLVRSFVSLLWSSFVFGFRR